MKLPPLVSGALLRRYKRFLADIALDSGETITAHCANPGSMRGLAEPGSRVYLSQSDNPKRKLSYSWELVATPSGLVCVNTARANPLVAEALTAGSIKELAGFNELRREVPYGDSRIDFELWFGSRRCLLEVKNVTLDFGDGTSAFPDSVTTRGARHLAELEHAKAAGARAVLLFCCSRSDTRRVVPASAIDPTYAAALRRAAAAGVEVLAYAGRVELRRLSLTHAVPVELGVR